MHRVTSCARTQHGNLQAHFHSLLLTQYRSTEQELRSALDKVHALKVAMAELTAKSAAAALRYSTTPPPHQPAPSHHHPHTAAASLAPGAVPTSGASSTLGAAVNNSAPAELLAKLAELQATVAQWERVGAMATARHGGGGSGSGAGPAWRVAQAALEQQLHELAELRRGAMKRDEQLVAAGTGSAAVEQQLTLLQRQLDDCRVQLQRALLSEAVAERRLAAVEQVWQ